MSTKSLTTNSILVTSEAGDKLAVKKNVSFVEGKATDIVIRIYPDVQKQRIEGIGTSFTESSAFVLSHLTDNTRKELMRDIYGTDGANFSLARTPIGSCDFSVEGKYSYADKPDDKDLTSFSISEDSRGFDKDKYPGVRNERYDLLPMIKEALSINPDIKIVASAWTAPSWMKDIDDWYIPGSPANNWQGTGGHLKDEYGQTYADYLVKYLQAYQDEGVNIWAVTPVNEPHGNNGQWESPRPRMNSLKIIWDPHYTGTGLAILNYSFTIRIAMDWKNGQMRSFLIRKALNMLTVRPCTGMKVRTGSLKTCWTAFILHIPNMT
jgi:glucosylceramidase